MAQASQAASGNPSSHQEVIYRELQQAVHDLNSRGLYHAAQWAAEQLAGLDVDSGREGWMGSCCSASARCRLPYPLRRRRHCAAPCMERADSSSPAIVSMAPSRHLSLQLSNAVVPNCPCLPHAAGVLDAQACGSMLEPLAPEDMHPKLLLAQAHFVLRVSAWGGDETSACTHACTSLPHHRISLPQPVLHACTHAPPPFFPRGSSCAGPVWPTLHAHACIPYRTITAQEYRRAAHALSGLHGPRPTFLRLYATFLAGEKRRE